MSAETKTTIATISVFLLAVLGMSLRHVKPLVPAGLTVLYTETEDFQSNGAAYAPAFRRGLLYLHLPNAKEGHRWWLVNYSSKTVNQAEPPVAIFRLKLVLRRDLYGISRPVEARDQAVFYPGRDVSFSRSGLICIVIQGIKSPNHASAKTGKRIL